MKSLLQSVLNGLRNLFSSRKPPLDRGRLVGMYLSQANALDSQSERKSNRSRERV